MPFYLRLLTIITCAVALLTLESSSILNKAAKSPTAAPTSFDTTVVPTGPLSKEPTIIIVLSETFWDMTRLPNVKFSRDPIPTFRRLAELYPSGTMLSPMFGGGTANVELEVLTGKSYRFFEDGSNPYETVIKQPTGSLAHILAGQGYSTAAISSYHHWHLGSSEVYKHLGFQRFISYDYFNPDEFVGPYIGDHAVAKRIIEQTRQTEGPDFIFANTMENHYHYFEGKFDKNTIDVKGSLGREARGVLETYAQGSSGADHMLQELVDYFNRSGEPVVLVWFGDHLPYFDKDYFIYRDTHYISGENDPDFLEKMHRVPLLVWSNAVTLPTETLNMSPSFLGPYVLKAAGRQGNAFTDYLEQLSKRMPIVPPESHYAEYSVDRSLVEEYRMLQEAGLQAEIGGAAGLIDPPGYQHGYEQAIDSVSPNSVMLGESFRTEHGRSVMVVRGHRFGIGSTLFMDGKKLTTKWHDEGTLSAEVPKDILTRAGLHSVQVKVIDSKEQVIAESDTAPFLVNALR